MTKRTCRPGLLLFPAALFLACCFSGRAHARSSRFSSRIDSVWLDRVPVTDSTFHVFLAIRLDDTYASSVQIKTLIQVPYEPQSSETEAPDGAGPSTGQFTWDDNSSISRSRRRLGGYASASDLYWTWAKPSDSTFHGFQHAYPDSFIADIPIALQPGEHRLIFSALVYGDSDQIIAFPSRVLCFSMPDSGEGRIRNANYSGVNMDDRRLRSAIASANERGLPFRDTSMSGTVSGGLGVVIFTPCNSSDKLHMKGDAFLEAYWGAWQRQGAVNSPPIFTSFEGTLFGPFQRDYGRGYMFEFHATEVIEMRPLTTGDCPEGDR